MIRPVHSFVILSCILVLYHVQVLGASSVVTPFLSSSTARDSWPTNRRPSSRHGQIRSTSLQRRLRDAFEA